MVTWSPLVFLACTWLGVASFTGNSDAPFCGIAGIGTSSRTLVIVNGFFGWRYT